MKNLALLMILGISLAGPAICQDEESLDIDTSNMRVTISLDRQTYLPGEVAQVRTNWMRRIQPPSAPARRNGPW